MSKPRGKFVDCCVSIYGSLSGLNAQAN
jgi:hypothetical protein